MKTSLLKKTLRTVPSIAALTLALSSLSAFAQTPAAVIEKSRQLNQTIRLYAQSLPARELVQIEAQLDRALALVLGRSIRSGPGTGPGNGGGRLPPRGGQPMSTCKLLGHGPANGWTYSYRISMNDQIMEGTNNFEQALSQLNRYAQDGMCSIAPEDACKLAGPGSYAGWTYQFRVMVGDAAFSGTNNSTEALNMIKRLEDNGVCRMNIRMESCQLLGRGSYNGWTYNYRVSVGAEILNGTNDYNAAKAFIDTLRNSKTCY